MASNTDTVDPCNVPGVNERLRTWSSGDQAVRPVDIAHVVIDENAIDALVDLVRSLSGGGRTMVVMDGTPMARGGDDLKSLLEDRLSSVVPLTARRLSGVGVVATKPDGRGSSATCAAGAFSATVESARSLADELAGYSAVVSVGSGSVTDVAKYARHLAGEGRAAGALPMICFPTAASVTAYTSAMVALTVHGVKRSLRARAPEAIVCDLRTLADAPRPMTAAGFGDVLARSVAGGDWFLASQLGMDDGFCDVPIRLLAAAEQRMIDSAERVAAADLVGVRHLTEAVLLAGMAMSIVDQTAPMSGWEHVISHCLDLTAKADGRMLALHGAQVGVATLVVARAYERSWADLDLDRVQADADVAAYRRTLDRHFGRLDHSGRLVAEIWADLEKKLIRWNNASVPRRTFADRKRAGALKGSLSDHVRPSAEVAAALNRAGAPHRFGDLCPPICETRARAAIERGHLIRARFSLGDLLAHTGWLDEQTTTALLADA